MKTFSERAKSENMDFNLHKIKLISNNDSKCADQFVHRFQNKRWSYVNVTQYKYTGYHTCITQVRIRALQRSYR